MKLPDNAYQNLKELSTWIERNGIAGYDPYDIKAHPRIINLIARSQQSLFYTVIRELTFEFFYSFPVLSRKIFRIKPTFNAKAIGLLADAYLDLFTFTKDKTYLSKADHYLNWLLHHPGKAESGLGWGYPFDWQSAELIPANTPNGIVTTAVGEAFWKRYSMRKDPADLVILINIGRFLADLPKDKTADDKLCFSYTPLFQNHVHNLNLFIAEFLLKVGIETGNEDWIDLARKAVNYTIGNQNPDGSFEYNGPPEQPANYIDHYHTGFVLRMLFSIRKLTEREDIDVALQKGYRFYIENFFEGPVPKLKPDQKYKIDIHSCAEAVICLCTLQEIFPGSCDKAREVLNWTINNLQDPSGYFYYGILKSRLLGFTRKSKIPYFRWGQAWMMKALATYLKTTYDNLSTHA